MVSKRAFKALSMILVLVTLVAAACGGNDKDTSDKTTKTEKPVIKLVTLPWDSAALDVAVARIILEQKMGYPVELVPSTSNDQFEAVASGAAHASLEVWTTSQPARVQEYVYDKKTVENGGPLGAIGQSGWYIPRYMLAQFPDIRDWESLKDPAVAAALATPETGGKGRLLSGDPGWGDYQISESLLKNLGLDFVIQGAGSEEAELEIIGAAYDKQEPFMFHLWTPHWVFALYDLYRINLPPFTEGCNAVVAEIACDFPEDHLMKIFSLDLATYAPEVHQFLKNFTLTNSDQITMMATVKLDKQSIDQVAQAWVDNNESVWKAWIPAAESP